MKLHEIVAAEGHGHTINRHMRPVVKPDVKQSIRHIDFILSAARTYASAVASIQQAQGNGGITDSGADELRQRAVAMLTSALTPTGK